LQLIFEALIFGFAVGFMIVGLVGIVVPILPGTLLIWLTVLIYAVIDGFETVGWVGFIIITIIALVTGTADLWLPVLGAKSAGAAKRAMVFGLAGGVIGFFLLGGLIPILGSLLGSVLGYAAGVLLGQYHKYRDWNLALRAGLGSMAGWGIGTAIQFGGGLLIVALFILQVLSS
jgi:uncharacterized protein YqgC (DUF456 family)